MSGLKPNNFPLATIPLGGAEEIYSQAGDVFEKYTVEDVKDYTLSFISGDTAWIKDANGVHNITEDIGIGVAVPTAALDVLGASKLTYVAASGTFTQSADFEPLYIAGLFDSEVLAWNFENLLGETGLHELTYDAIYGVSIHQRVESASGFYESRMTPTSKSDQAYVSSSQNATSSVQSGAVSLQQTQLVAGDSYTKQMTLSTSTASLSISKNGSDAGRMEVMVQGDGQVGLRFAGIREYADDTAAATAGLAANEVYHTAGVLKIKL